MSKDKGTSSRVVDFSTASLQKSGKVAEARKEAKIKQLRSKFSAARQAAESPSTSAEKVKKLFKNKRKPPGNRR